jgi:molybdopterin-guanine dinucleotide biosynthesis protein A
MSTQTLQVSSVRITGVLLAGGQGRRMGGVDKGLVPLAGKPMAAHALERLSPQVDELIISANRNTLAWEAFGYRVLSDDIQGYAGPLAGLHAALTRASHPLVVTAPCDSPYLPIDLVARLAAAWHATGADVAVVKTFERLHPVFCLCGRETITQLDAYLAAGGRRMDRWYADLKVVEVAFDDQDAAFRNINTREDLAQAAHDGATSAR